MNTYKIKSCAGPYFSHYTAGNVSVMEGDIAHLPCRVLQVLKGLMVGLITGLIMKTLHR